MKNITNYREFNEEKNAPSVKEAVREAETPHKSDILEYMKSFKEDVVCPGRVYDEIAQKPTAITLVYYTDGEYIWDEREMYHFEHYNILLNEEFIRKVIGK